jgi:hypothetical protein
MRRCLNRDNGSARLNAFFEIVDTTTCSFYQFNNFGCDDQRLVQAIETQVKPFISSVAD